MHSIGKKLSGRTATLARREAMVAYEVFQRGCEVGCFTLRLRGTACAPGRVLTRSRARVSCHPANQRVLATMFTVTHSEAIEQFVEGDVITRTTSLCRTVFSLFLFREIDDALDGYA